MRDGFSDGFFTRTAHDTHPVDLMCLYLLHGSVERIPGLLVDRETLSHLYGLEFRIHFIAGEPYADAAIPIGATVDLPTWMISVRASWSSATDARSGST
ncbi:hypothetical protein [Streptomyces griseorubiginosus]|uniref:hypothetical protein n=1 Tax=Streptomyces griseorubiginosus TaxID=67304 RepID=UPI0036E9DE29